MYVGVYVAVYTFDSVTLLDISGVHPANAYVYVPSASLVGLVCTTKSSL